MNITSVPSPNFTAGRQGAQIDTFVLHWIVGTQAAADNVFTSKKSGVSAHFSVEEGSVHQYVKLQDIAWHAGNWEWNKRSIGTETSAQPRRDATAGTIETIAELWAECAKQLGRPLDSFQFKRHRDIIPTACPGTVPLEAIVERAKAIEAASRAQVDQPQTASIPAVVASAPVKVPVIGTVTVRVASPQPGIKGALRVRATPGNGTILRQVYDGDTFHFDDVRTLEDGSKWLHSTDGGWSSAALTTYQ